MNSTGQFYTDYKNIKGAFCEVWGRRASQQTMPAFAGSLNVGDKPIVVAENVNVRIGGVGVGAVSDIDIETMVASIRAHEDTTAASIMIAAIAR